MNSEIFVKRMMECGVCYEPVTRTWYISVITRSRSWVRTDYFLLEGKGVAARLWDILQNGVPATCVVPPAVACYVQVEYREMDDVIQLVYSEGSRDGWPRVFSHGHEAWLFLRDRINDLELSVLQKTLSEGV
jgi:hypothetical protein